MIRLLRRLAAALMAATIGLQGVALADSVGPFGVGRKPVLDDSGFNALIDGRPLTYSESDMFACVQAGPRAEVYQVPYLYVSDQTSIPNKAHFVLGDLLAMYGGLNPAYTDGALIHDYLYAVGNPGDVGSQAIADTVFFNLMRAQRVNSKIIYTFEGTFQKVRERRGASNPFGQPKEWARWANPDDQSLSAFTPVKQGASARVMSLPNCRVFDDNRADRGRRLHACLHYRYMSTRDTKLWPPAGRYVTDPVFPQALRLYADTLEEAQAYLAGDCSAYSTG